jgi:hypothetical protein
MKTKPVSNRIKSFDNIEPEEMQNIPLSVIDNIMSDQENRVYVMTRPVKAISEIMVDPVQRVCEEPDHDHYLEPLENCPEIFCQRTLIRQIQES